MRTVHQVLVNTLLANVTTGMGWLLAAGVVLISLSGLHLVMLRIPEPEVVHAEGVPAKVDFAATFRMVRAVPGLLGLIVFSTFNNLLAGVPRPVAHLRRGHG